MTEPRRTGYAGTARGIPRRARSSIGLLRFLTCGSVDDGKSTLIGRLLYDTKLLFEDQLAALEHDSASYGTTGDDIDFALLVDGLEAEREQGITIDVAYRFFATDKRTLHRRRHARATSSTRATWRPAPPTADLAVILIDARKGVLTQTRRHAYIASLLGIRHVVLAVNKIDLVGLRRGALRRDRRRLPRLRGASSASPAMVAIPISARFGDNVIEPAPRHALVHAARRCSTHLETVDVGRRRRGAAVPHAGAMGQPARISISAASPARSPRGTRAPRRPRVAVATSGRTSHGRAHRHHGRRSAAQPAPATPSP